MEIKTVETTPNNWSGDALALGFFEDSTELNTEWTQLDNQLEGTISELITETEFDGKLGSKATTRVGRNFPIRKIILVGLGPEGPISAKTLNTVAAHVARVAKQEKIKRLGFILPSLNDTALGVRSLTEGLLMALHIDNRFKSKSEEQSPLETVEFLGAPNQDQAISIAQAMVSGTILARELVAAPANSVTPITLAETASELAKEYGLNLEILDYDKCEELGMGAYLGVAKASDIPPKFIHLTYRPEGTPRRKVAIVGKGLTFDSGGLNIKTVGSSIAMMKVDMGGAGATFGAAKAIAQLKPDVEVHFISAATENMISGKAMHPGDILTASNGKTIEVNNTDAEGRLTLADALVFAEQLEVDAIVDLATLTGACVVALGEHIAGLWSPDQTLADEIKAAGELAGEEFWQMPLKEEYFEGMKSIIADMKNTGPREGGSITAALFLKQFVEKTPWVHLDIAGPVWTEKEVGPHNAGATGYPVRTLVNWVLS